MNTREQTLVKVAREMEELAHESGDVADEDVAEKKKVHDKADVLLIELLRAFSSDHHNLIEAILKDYNWIDFDVEPQ